ncbi:MAG: amidohydrolase family protein [Phycisphaerales bacterium]|nr:amidohydrolase family protein [Phycisphaerales bacterium]
MDERTSEGVCRPSRRIGILPVINGALALILAAGATAVNVVRAESSVANEPQERTHRAGGPVTRYLVVRCGTLLDVPGKPAKKSVTLVVKDGAVESILPGLDAKVSIPAGAAIEELNLSEQWVLPGLIDCHVHLAMEFTPDSRLRMMAENDVDAAFRSVAFAKKNLLAGFTTVRDLGAGGDVVLKLRDAIDRGDVIGPRIIAAGKAISVTGGHADPTNGLRSDVFGLAGVDEGVADGADACRKAVRNQIKLGADCIKLTATGGVLSVSTAGLAKHFFDDELKAIIDTSHAMGRKAAAHAHGVDGINAALRAGVDSIEHGTYLDDESVRLFKDKGAFLVPTLLAGETVSTNAKIPGYYLKVVADKASMVGPRMLEMFRKAHDGGVKIAFGTDTGVSPHGENAREFALMVKGGMTPEETIVAATITASELCGVSRLVGTLEPGKRADLISVPGDPLADISVLESVIAIVKDGVVVREIVGK